MYPLDFFTLGLIGGLLAAGLPTPLEIGGGALFAAVLLGISFALRRVFQNPEIKKPVAPFLLAAAGALGAVFILLAYQWSVPSHHLIRHLPRGRANLAGHILKPVEFRNAPGRRPRIYIEVERLSVRGVEIPVQGNVRISLSASPPPSLDVGHRVIVRRIRLRRPIRYRNPGAFDYREFLRLRSVHATAYASPRAIEIIAPRERSGLQSRIFGFRERMSRFIRSAFSPETGGLLEAIALGVREELQWDVRESFRLSGASHILAISGLHVGFISAFFFFGFLALFRRLPPGAFPLRPIVFTPFKAAAIASIPVVILFAVLTGSRVSTVRAAIMAVVYLLTRVLERPGGAMHSVLLAALIILLFQPGFVWDTGFQLSFIAVAAIILAVRRLPRLPAQRSIRDPQWWRVRLLQFAGIQGVVSFTMAPMTALHFQEIHLAGLVTNFFLIPIASILVPLTFLMSCFAVAVDFFRLIWLGPILAIAEAAAEFLASSMIGVARLGAAIPGATLSVPRPSALQIAVFLAALAAALGLRRSALRKAGWAVASLSILLIVAPIVPSSPAPTGQSTLLLPDAGRKNAFFIRLPDGRGYAVDGNRRSRARFDMWRNVLAPLLRNQREHTWEGLFLLAQSGPGGSAEKQLAIGMSLARVMEVARGGSICARAPGGAEAEALPPGAGGRSPVLWRTEASPARLSLK
ncbi:MAG: ComEC/Rec2 family competence protein, partial [bacterium]